MTSKLTSRPASDLSLTELADAFNLAFANYMGREITPFTAESLEKWCTTNFISLSVSHVFFLDSNPSEAAAFGLIATRADKPFETRLVSMGVVPATRGQRVGSRALKAIADAERERGMKVLGLECIRENEAALNLYQGGGFTVVRELAEWHHGVPAPGEFAANEELVECTVEEVDVMAKAHGVENLPWQVWGFSKSTIAKRAFKLGNAHCVITDPDKKEGDAVCLLTLIVEPQARGKGEALKLAEAVMGKFEGQKWKVNGVHPKEYTEKIATRLGFDLQPMLMYQMQLDL